MKRAADIVVSLVGLFLALSLFPFLTLLIKLDSPGPIYYSQQSIGRGNVPFRAWKLRTPGTTRFLASLCSLSS